MPRRRQLAGHRLPGAILGLFVGPPPIQTHTRAAVLRGELDTGLFQRTLDLGEGLDGPADRAIAVFHALHGGDVDTGPLGKLARGPTQFNLLPPVTGLKLENKRALGRSSSAAGTRRGARRQTKNDILI